MARISANLGFLWTELALPEAIRAAAGAGFDAVECHWPYRWAANDVREALVEAGLPMLCINVSAGREHTADFGLAAVPGRASEFREAAAEAIDYAGAIGCTRVQAVAGLAHGAEAHAVAVENLAWACEQAAPRGIEVLIEPKNARDVPGYFLTRVEQAATLIAEVGAANLALLFDCYHVQINEGDLTRRFERYRDIIAHVQIAAVPERNEPDRGEVAYQRLIARFLALGYQGYFGAEYRPSAGTAATLAWLPRFQRIGNDAAP